METKWLEDFITLAHTKNFSKAASLRCVTQPAFSRRIQALEGWLGCELIDRGSYPTRLSAQGEVFYEQALSMLEKVRQARTIVRGGSLQSRQPVRLVVPHTLACSRAPQWVAALKQKLAAHAPDFSVQLTASNVHDAVLSFTDGASDFLVCYHHSREPIELDPTKFEMRLLGSERFGPYSAADANGNALYCLDPLAPLPVPFLAYSKHAYLSKMTDIALEAGPLFLKKTLFETDMSESLKAFCEQGLGVAWLPESAVATDQGLLSQDGVYCTDLEVRLYRRRDRNRDSSVGTVDLLEMVWQHWPE